MAKLNLSLAIGNHDLTLALTHGEIEVEGVNLIVSRLPDSTARHKRIANLEFDLGEYSMCSYIVAAAKGTPFTAIPVFPHRRFPHSNIIVNAHAGINSPADLRGKRIGVNSLQTTWTLWSAGMLEEHYGVPFQELRWYSSTRNLVDSTTPDGISVASLPAGKSLNQALLDRDIDAVTGPSVQPAIRNGSPEVRRLFPDFKDEEMRLYRKTGVFPIMHVIVIKKTVVEEHPWVARNLLSAFETAKNACYRFIDSSWSLSLVWYRTLWEEERNLFGGKDVWAYNIKDNEENLATMIRYARQQGMTEREMAVRDLFAQAVRE